MADLERAEPEEVLRPLPSPGKYARLLQISYPAIKSRDHQARIIAAGMPGYGDVAAWTFLSNLYSVAGIKAYFDAVALHPYGSTLNQVKTEIQRVRNVMTKRGDAATPLWVDEIAWGPRLLTATASTRG